MLVMPWKSQANTHSKVKDTNTSPVTDRRHKGRVWSTGRNDDSADHLPVLYTLSAHQEQKVCTILLDPLAYVCLQSVNNRSFYL